MRKCFWLIWFALFLTACNTTNKPATPDTELGTVLTTATEHECIHPLENFSFLPSGGERKGPKPDYQLPGHPWQETTDIPYRPSSQEAGLNWASLDLIQEINAKNEIWITINGSDTKLVRYQIDSQQWQNVDSTTEQKEKLGNSPLLVKDKNNLIWLPRNYSWDAKVEINTPMLSVYDEEKGRFQTILTVNDFLSSESLAENSSIEINDIQLDSKGTFWFIVSFDMDGKNWQYKLFSFSPSTHQLEQHFSNLEYAPRNNISFVISSDDIIILLDWEKEILVEYDISKNKSTTINIPNQVVTNSNEPNQNLNSAKLFLDNQQRLWIDDRGWLDLFPQGDWHIVIRSPIFIYYQYYGNGIWSWLLPTFSFESDDGRLWYSSLRGTGWVNTETSQWCLFSTYSSNVVKDSKGNLWMIADGKLYKHPPNP